MKQTADLKTLVMRVDLTCIVSTYVSPSHVISSCSKTVQDCWNLKLNPLIMFSVRQSLEITFITSVCFPCVFIVSLLAVNSSFSWWIESETTKTTMWTTWQCLAFKPSKSESPRPFGSQVRGNRAAPVHYGSRNRASLCFAASCCAASCCSASCCSRVVH